MFVGDICRRTSYICALVVVSTPLIKSLWILQLVGTFHSFLILEGFSILLLVAFLFVPYDNRHSGFGRPVLTQPLCFLPFA